MNFRVLTVGDLRGCSNEPFWTSQPRSEVGVFKKFCQKISPRFPEMEMLISEILSLFFSVNSLPIFFSKQ